MKKAFNGYILTFNAILGNIEKKGKRLLLTKICAIKLKVHRYELERTLQISVSVNDMKYAVGGIFMEA